MGNLTSLILRLRGPTVWATENSRHKSMERRALSSTLLPMMVQVLKECHISLMVNYKS